MSRMPLYNVCKRSRHDGREAGESGGNSTTQCEKRGRVWGDTRGYILAYRLKYGYVRASARSERFWTSTCTATWGCGGGTRSCGRASRLARTSPSSRAIWGHQGTSRSP
eukprot:6183887-Pyramimonas_sp.AAC.2